MRRRTVPDRATTAQVTDRDLVLLAFIARAGPVTTDHVRQFAAMSLAMARRRLRALFDIGHIATFVQHQEAPNRYIVTARGRDELVERGVVAEDAVRLPKSKPQANQHHDGAVRFYVALYRACQTLHTVRVVRFLFERDIRAAVPDARGALIPDAAGVLERADGGEQLGVALEVDRGTEKNPSWVAERKGVPYAELHRNGVPLAGATSWRVLCTVPTERRRNRLAAAVYAAGVPEGLWYFALEADVRAEQVLRPIWRTVRLAPDGSSACLVPESPFLGMITDRDGRDHGISPTAVNHFGHLASAESTHFTGGGNS